ncbi:MAG: helix-turn-helix domain-containing protein [Chloroflexota bacterium]
MVNERLTYNVSTAAKLLGLSRNAAYQGCLTGQIPHLKIGKRILIPRVQLERLLAGEGNDNETKRL